MRVCATAGAVEPADSRSTPNIQELTAIESRATRSGVTSPAQTAARQVLLASSVEAEAQLMERLGDHYPRLLDKQRELFRSVGLAQGGVICDESSSSAILAFSQPEDTVLAAGTCSGSPPACSGPQVPPSGGRWRSTYAGSQPRARASRCAIERSSGS